MRRAPILLLLAAALLAPEPAFAQAACSVGNANDNSLDQIVTLYRSCARQWEATLGAHALTLFWLLAAIEFAWAAIRLVLRGADFNEWLAELVTQVFFLGLFLALLTNATAWTGAIVESFRTAAAEALRANGVASGIAPSDIFDTGVNIATRMIEQFSLFSAPVQSLFLVAASLVILVCFALIAAALILALVESYIVLSAGVLLLGFGGSRWTKDFAVKTLIYAVSVGAKLFVLQLIAGLGAQIVGAWARLPVGSSLFSPANATSNILVILGSTLVLWVLVKTVPDMIQGLINGTALGVNTGLASAVTSLAGSTYALGMLVSSARDLSREQITEAQLANPGQSGPGMARRSLGNIGSAAVANIGTRLSGRATNGDRIAQVARDMHREAADLRSERERGERQAQKGSTTPSQSPSPGGSPPSPQAPSSSAGPTQPRSGAQLATGTPANQNTPPSPPKKP